MKEEEGLNKYIKGMLKVKVLHDGESFGELALINNQPRSGTLICEGDCVFAVLSKEQFQSILKV